MKRVKIKRYFLKNIFYSNQYMFFLPLLIIYTILILVMAEKNILIRDEGGYYNFANNLLQGFYSPKDDINLWHGPGYPLILTIFVWLKLPFLYPKLLNAIFLYFSIIFIYKTFLLYMNNKKAMLFSYFLGLYIPIIYYLIFMHTEVFSFFLICGFIFSICNLFVRSPLKIEKSVIPSFFLGYLALTKIIFGYVILTGLILFMLSVFFKNKKAKTVLSIYLLALVLCIPYLTYTYLLTNKIFYWGNSGGLSLYWMSTPYRNEYGDLHPSDLRNNPELIKNHGLFFEKISKLSSIEKDNALKKQAIQNIKAHPQKFIFNWFANIGRMIFSYPYSYCRHQDYALLDFFYIIPHSFIFVFFILSLFLAVKIRQKIPFEIFTILTFGIIYFIGSSLLSAYARQFVIIVPIVYVWVVYILANFIRFNVTGANNRVGG